MDFVSSETGAVTVDWVVLTAALVGLGLAVSNIVSAGASHQSDEIAGQLRSNHILDLWDQVRVDNDFENGPGDWSGGNVRDIAGFGNILTLDRHSRDARLPIDIDGDHEFAVIELDMIVADSWDEEAGTISIGGAEVIGVDHWWRDPDGPDVQVFDGSDGTQVTLTRVSRDSGTWGNRNARTTHDDYTFRAEIVRRNDGSDLTLGASTNLNSGFRDEFFGIDNVRVTGSDRP